MRCLTPLTPLISPDRRTIRIAHGVNIRKTCLQALGISLSGMRIPQYFIRCNFRLRPNSYGTPAKYFCNDYILPGSFRNIISRYLPDDKATGPDTRSSSRFFCPVSNKPLNIEKFPMRRAQLLGRWVVYRRNGFGKYTSNTTQKSIL